MRDAPTPPPISTIPDLVTQLGGNDAVAKLTGVGRSAVSNWKTGEVLPARVKFTLYREVERRGLNVDMRLFGEAA